MTQHELLVRPPMQVIDPSLIARQPNMTHALRLTLTSSGLPDKAFVGSGGIVKDQAQWSRIMHPGGGHNFPQDKLGLFMDIAGNEAAMLWLVHSRGYDISSLRKLETETERALRMERERAADLEKRLRYAEDLLHGRRGG